MRALLLALLLPCAALAAPNADPLQVDLWSRMDEFNAARGVQRPAAPSELKRAAPDPALEALLDRFLDQNANTGLLVLKDRTILAERYQYGRTEGHRFASASMAKTVVAMLVGIAVHERRIKSIDHVAGYYFTRLQPHPYGEVSIRDLLTMSSGLVSREEINRPGESLKLVRNTLRQQTAGGMDAIREFDWRIAPAGTRFRYASSDTQVLGLVLTAATFGTVADYLSEKIWKPMGAEANATWLTDKAGYEAAFCCLNAVLRDYGRFGLLLANYGALDGKQIIPAEWVKAATTVAAPHLKVGTATKHNGYGYQTWLTDAKRPRFAAFGLHGQAIFVDAISKLVVVHTAVWADGDDRAARGRQFRLWETLLSRLAA